MTDVERVFGAENLTYYLLKKKEHILHAESLTSFSRLSQR
jgi:hypothetical protein